MHKVFHTGVKPHECDICEKTFSQKSGLARHKIIHTIIKPFSCDLCQKSFSQSFHLTQHDKTSAHLKKVKSRNNDSSYYKNNFVDCDESIKEEDIKVEIKEEESVIDTFPIDYYTVSDINQEIKEEVKESDKEQSVEDSNFVDCSEYVQVEMNQSK